MNDDQLLRYSRHILLDDVGIEGQQHLIDSHVLVVGVDSMLTQLAKCCKPAPPDLICGFVTKGKGVSFMENSVDWHYKSPNDAQLAQALAELQEPTHA